MISLIRRYQKPLFIAVIAIFLIGTFVGLGGYFFTNQEEAQAVAIVGAEKIPYSRFIQRVNQYVDALRDKQPEVTDEMIKEIKIGMLRDMIVDELLLTKADELGLTVTDAELARDIRGTPAFQRSGAFEQEAYFQAVRSVFRDSPQAYEEMRRKTMRTNKVKQFIFQSAKFTPQELEELYARQNKGSMKNFDKEKQSFAERAQQQRALELINYYLRQLSSQVEIRSYLEQREAGV